MENNVGEPLWFGQYRLTSRVATGGMAEVYVGRHITDDGVYGPLVAVKRLLPHLAKDQTIVRMFLNEARITAQIKHPNVVSIVELGMVDTEPFIAMELLEGRTFADLRDRAAEEGKRVPLPVALRILIDACTGLDAAHTATDDSGQPLSLVHRDFTPDNIHVSVQGFSKVIDFGIAKTTPWSAGTEPGTLKGKFFYMSPEMILAKPVDHRADIFAAGVMLYEQLCGHRPFTGNSIDEVVMKIARSIPPVPSSYDFSVPAELENACMRALKHDRNQRFATLNELVVSIESMGLAATREAVGEYVATLFPAKTDARRQTLRKARELDPSNPGIRHELGDEELAPTAASPLRRHGGDDVGTAPTARLAPLRIDVPSTAPDVAPTPVANRGRGALYAIIAIILLGLIGAAIVLFKPKQTPDSLLAEARALLEADRAQVLASLDGMPEVQQKHFEEAAKMLIDSQRWDTAALIADAWVLRTPENVEAQLFKARVATEQKKGKRAEEALAAAGKLAPGDTRVDAQLATLRSLQGDEPAAILAWSALLKKMPQDPTAAKQLGFLLSRSGKLEDAADALLKASRRGPDAEVLAELGFVRFRQEQLPEAQKLLDQAVKVNPQLMVAHYYRAAVQYARGDKAGARASYALADSLAGSDARPLSDWCKMEAQLESQAQPSEIAKVKHKITERFAEKATTLLAGCVP